MKKLIYKDVELEVFKTKNKNNPYILELNGVEYARFNCANDDEVAFVLPKIFEILNEFMVKQNLDIEEFNINIDSDLNAQVKHAMHYH